MQLLQLAVQFLVLSMIRQSNLIWGTQTSIAVLHQLFIKDESQVITFRVANCDAIHEIVSNPIGYSVTKEISEIGQNV